MLTYIFLEIKNDGNKTIYQVNNLYAHLCLPGQFSCQSDEIKFHDNIFAVVAHLDNETLISGTLAKPVDI